MNQRKPEGACVCAISASLTPLLHNPPHRALTAFLLLYHRNPHRRPPAGAPGTPRIALIGPALLRPVKIGTSSADQGIKPFEKNSSKLIWQKRWRSSGAAAMRTTSCTWRIRERRDFCALPLFHIFGSFQGVPFIFPKHRQTR